jgi:hypothetical protein
MLPKRSNIGGQRSHVAEKRSWHPPIKDSFAQSLTTASDHYLVSRGDEKTVIVGYHWFGDWGRDTMIALPGLTLPTGKYEVARSILRTFAKHVDQGMLPNRFPDTGETPEYNAVDTALSFLEAARAYLAYTGDLEFVRDELYLVFAHILLKLGAWPRFSVPTSRMYEVCDRIRGQAAAQPKARTGQSPKTSLVQSICTGTAAKASSMHPSLCAGIKGRNARYQCRWKNTSACGEHRRVATVVVEQKLLCLSQQRAGRQRGRRFSNRTELTTCPPPQKLLDLVASI